MFREKDSFGWPRGRTQPEAGLIQKGPFEVIGAVSPLLCFVFVVVVIADISTTTSCRGPHAGGGHNIGAPLNTELNKSLKLLVHIIRPPFGTSKCSKCALPPVNALPSQHVLRTVRSNNLQIKLPPEWTRYRGTKGKTLKCCFLLWLLIEL